MGLRVLRAGCTPAKRGRGLAVAHAANPLRTHGAGCLGKKAYTQKTHKLDPSQSYMYETLRNHNKDSQKTIHEPTTRTHENSCMSPTLNPKP